MTKFSKSESAIYSVLSEAANNLFMEAAVLAGSYISNSESEAKIKEQELECFRRALEVEFRKIAKEVFLNIKEEDKNESRK